MGRSRLRTSNLLRALFITLLLPGLAVVLLEIVSRGWVGGDERARDMLDVFKGLLAALGVTAFVGWIVIESLPPLLPAGPSRLEPGRRPNRMRSANYAQWFIGMRWIAVFAATALVFFTVELAHLLPRHLLLPLLLTIAVLATSNATYGALLRSGWSPDRLLPLQVYGDLGLLTLLLHFSGGVENPLAMLMLLHVIIGGIILTRRRCYQVAAVATLLFAALAVAEGSGLVQHYTLDVFPHAESGRVEHAANHALYVTSTVGMQGVLLFLTAYFVSSLADRLRQDEHQLERMAERALAERQLLERALVTTDMGLRVLDGELHPEWTNARWESWFTGVDVVPRLDGDGSSAWSTLRDGRVRVTEVACPAASADGAERIFQITTAPLLDAEHKATRVVELAQDVTTQKRLQAQMVRAEQLAAVGELAGQVAHEVNNPIAIISAKVRLLLSDERERISEKAESELHKISDLADRVARVAQGLLSYCRPAQGARVRLDLCTPIRGALSMAGQRAAAAGVRVADRLPASLPAVDANEGEMEQVFLNLFLNALDATPRGGELVVSHLSNPVPLGDGSPALEVRVRDTGRGIAAELLKRIFEPFYSTKTEGKGTGLGLSICQGLIRSHGGQISVESRPGAGTTVTIRLPLAAGKERDA